MRPHHSIGYALILLLLPPIVYSAQHETHLITSPVILTETSPKHSLGRHVEYLEDPTQHLTLDDVISAPYTTQFIPSREDLPNFGFTRSAYWIRYQLQNHTSEPVNYLLEIAPPFTDLITVYRIDSVGKIEKRVIMPIRLSAFRRGNILHPPV